jgi:DNA-binding CsgD family transcriptional regulator
MQDIDSKIVLDGAFRVTTSGEVFRIKNGVESPACMIGMGRYKNQMAVSKRIGGKQRFFYVHKLVANAFIQNPNNLTCVRHKDGNPNNNNVSNLEWSTASDISRKASAMGLHHLMKNARPCLSCGRKTRAKQRVCPKCSLLEQRKDTQENIRERRIEAAYMLDMSDVTQRQSEAVSLRKKGLALGSIAVKMHISKQRVSQLLKRLAAT